MAPEALCGIRALAAQMIALHPSPPANGAAGVIEAARALRAGVPGDGQQFGCKAWPGCKDGIAFGHATPSLARKSLQRPPAALMMATAAMQSHELDVRPVVADQTARRDVAEHQRARAIAIEHAALAGAGGAGTAELVVGL